MENWITIYRGYSDVELDAELVWLRKQSRNPYGSQSEGNRSYARSTAEIRDRLAAATQVKNERSGADNGTRHLTADFSGVQP